MGSRFFTGDWHIGNENTRYDLLNHHIESIINTPGLYCILMGDERDNFLLSKDLSLAYQQVATPQQQAYVVESYLKRLDKNRKLLARVGGEHDSWTWVSSGISLENFWYSKMKSPLLENGGMINVIVNGIKYRISLIHTDEGRSIRNNPEAFITRQFEKKGGVDIVAIGGVHSCGIFHAYFGDSEETSRDAVLVRSGSYIHEEDDIIRPGGTVLLSAVEKRIFPLLKIDQAVEVLNSLNSLQKQ